MLLKLVPLAVLGVVLADANLLLNIASFAILAGGLVVAVVFGSRAWKARGAREDLTRANDTINTYKESHAAFEERIRLLEEDVKSCHTQMERMQQRNADLQAANAALQARSEAMQKYTAQESLATVEKLMLAQEHEAERRHLELIGVLQALQEAVGERRHQNLVDPPE